MRANRQANTEAGAPRWTYALSAIVGAAALLWAIVSFFVPKAEPTQPAAASAATQSVTVIGPNAVGVNTMSGGSIVIGAPNADPRSVPASVAK